MELPIKKNITACIRYVKQKVQIIVVSIMIMVTCLYGNNTVEIYNRTIEHAEVEIVRISDSLREIDEMISAHEYYLNSDSTLVTLCKQRLHLSKSRKSGTSGSMTVNALQQSVSMYRNYPGQKSGTGKLPQHIDQENNNLNLGKRKAGNTKLKSKAEEQADMREEQDRITNQWYNEIRLDETDIEIIAGNIGWKPSSVKKIKDHIFNNEHLLDRYVSLGEPAVKARFDPDFRQAKAWRRLKRGHHTAKYIE